MWCLLKGFSVSESESEVSPHSLSLVLGRNASPSSLLLTLGDSWRGEREGGREGGSEGGKERESMVSDTRKAGWRLTLLDPYCSQSSGR